MSLPRTEKFAALAATLVLAFTLLARDANAADQTWTGLTNANWATGANWLSTNAPVNGDSLVFDLTTPNNTTNNNITGLTTTGVNFAATAAASYTLNGNGVNLGWMTSPAPGIGITHQGDVVNDSLFAQTVNLPITLDSAKHIIKTGTSVLNLSKPITSSTHLAATNQPKGTSVVFNDGGGGINLTGSGLANDATGILGGWATIGADYAALDGTNKVVPYAAYTDVDVNAAGTIADGANTNVRIKVNGAATSVATPTTRINTLMFGDGVTASAAAQVVNVGAGNTVIVGQDGGFFNTTGAAGTVRGLTIGANVAGGGTLTAGDGLSPANINLMSTPINQAPQGNAGAFTINSVIADNNGQPVSLTIRGGYVTAGAANTFSGGLYILSGRFSQATPANIGAGDVYIYPGGQVNSNGNLINNFFIAGTGTTEQNNAFGGLGALRLFGAGTFSGTITLMENAEVSPTNNGVNALTGRITGRGGLIVGGTNGSQGGGILSIGATTGASARNNYAGDTIVRGHTGGAANNPIATLKINTNANPADNNFIMPHGANGSFAGGATGNLILDAQLGDAAHAVTFDLNGTKQAVNGLSSTATQASNNTVTSGAAGGVLYLGDSNATATYDGFITGSMGIVKIGAGSQTLTALNSYTDDTSVFDGTLSITNPYLAASSDVHVTPGAVFDLNFVGTNTIDSLYFGAAAQAAGTWGSLTSAATNKSARFSGTGLLDVQTLGSALLPGDFNGDKTVNDLDLAVWRADYGNNPGADADYDGDSDGNDFAIWQRNLGQSIPEVAAAASVPEPASLSLLVAGAMAIAAARRKRA